MAPQTNDIGLGQLIQEIMHTSAVLKRNGHPVLQSLLDAHHHQLRHPAPDADDRRAVVGFLRRIAIDRVWDIAFGLDAMLAETGTAS